MKSNCRVVKIQDIIEKVIDNRGKTPQCVDSGYPLLEVNAISSTKKFPEYEVVRKYVSTDVYKNYFRSGHPQVGDVLVPTVGTLGAVSYMNRNDWCIAQNLIALRANETLCVKEYLYYILNDNNTRKRLLNLNIGGVQPSIKVPHLLDLDIILPSTDTQKRITKVLADIDEKIELNNAINDNLVA